MPHSQKRYYEYHKRVLDFNANADKVILKRFFARYDSSARSCLAERPRRVQIIRLSTLARQQQRAIALCPPVASDISKDANRGSPLRFLRLSDQQAISGAIHPALPKHYH